MSYNSSYHGSGHQKTYEADQKKVYQEQGINLDDYDPIELRKQIGTTAEAKALQAALKPLVSGALTGDAAIKSLAELFNTLVTLSTVNEELTNRLVVNHPVHQVGMDPKLRSRVVNGFNNPFTGDMSGLTVVNSSAVSQVRKFTTQATVQVQESYKNYKGNENALSPSEVHVWMPARQKQDQNYGIPLFIKVFGSTDVAENRVLLLDLSRYIVPTDASAFALLTGAIKFAKVSAATSQLGTITATKMAPSAMTLYKLNQQKLSSLNRSAKDKNVIGVSGTKEVIVRCDVPKNQLLSDRSFGTMGTYSIQSNVSQIRQTVYDQATLAPTKFESNAQWAISTIQGHGCYDNSPYFCDNNHVMSYDNSVIGTQQAQTQAMAGLDNIVQINAGAGYTGAASDYRLSIVYGETEVYEYDINGSPLGDPKIYWPASFTFKINVGGTTSLAFANVTALNPYPRGAGYHGPIQIGIVGTTQAGVSTTAALYQVNLSQGSALPPGYLLPCSYDIHKLDPNGERMNMRYRYAQNTGIFGAYSVPNNTGSLGGTTDTYGSGAIYNINNVWLDDIIPASVPATGTSFDPTTISSTGAVTVAEFNVNDIPDAENIVQLTLNLNLDVDCLKAKGDTASTQGQTQFTFIMIAEDACGCTFGYLPVVKEKTTANAFSDGLDQAELASGEIVPGKIHIPWTVGDKLWTQGGGSGYYAQVNPALIDEVDANGTPIALPSTYATSTTTPIPLDGKAEIKPDTKLSVTLSIDTSAGMYGNGTFPVALARSDGSQLQGVANKETGKAQNLFDLCTDPNGRFKGNVSEFRQFKDYMATGLSRVKVLMIAGTNSVYTSAIPAANPQAWYGSIGRTTNTKRTIRGLVGRGQHRRNMPFPLIIATTQAGDTFAINGVVQASFASKDSQTPALGGVGNTPVEIDDLMKSINRKPNAQIVGQGVKQYTGR